VLGWGRVNILWGFIPAECVVLSLLIAEIGLREIGVDVANFGRAQDENEHED